jgi:hypothetical protein
MSISDQGPRPLRLGAAGLAAGEAGPLAFCFNCQTTVRRRAGARRASTFSRPSSRPSFARTDPLKSRGRREGRVSTDTRGPRADKNARGRNHRLSRKHPAFPARWFDGLLRALPGDRALLPPSPQKRALRAPGLSASVGAPGPHGLAVRESLAREPARGGWYHPIAIPAKADQLVRRRQKRPRAVAATAPRLNVRDDRETSLHEAGCAEECW